jgi:hypothetical protein
VCRSYQRRGLKLAPAAFRRNLGQNGRFLAEKRGEMVISRHETVRKRREITVSRHVLVNKRHEITVSSLKSSHF